MRSGPACTRRSALPDDEGHSLLLLDTTVLTFLTDDRKDRSDWDTVVSGRTPVLAFITVGEILHGTLRANWRKKQIAEIEALLRAYPVIPGTIGVARKYAELRRWFYEQIGDNDLWIAACALIQPEPLPLATADSDFDRIATKFPLQIVRPLPTDTA